MKFYNIEKDGVKNVIDEAQYEAIYKPNGWKIVSEEEPEIKEPTKPTDEIEKKNRNKMKRVAPKKFDDKLIKDE